MSDNNLSALKALIKELRDPQSGCAWTKAQDFKSLVPQTIDESYELRDAVLDEDINAIRDELGDLLYHVVFYAELANEQGWFDFEDVASVMLTKHQKRMPSKSQRQQLTAEQTNDYWHQEKAKQRQREGLFHGISTHLPSLLQAIKLQERASSVGFDWPEAKPILDKIHEELDEITSELDIVDNQDRLEAECGDLLFAVINLIRKCQLHPENALSRCNNTFVSRLSTIEATIHAHGKSWNDYSLDELEQLWQNAKQKEL